MDARRETSRGDSRDDTAGHARAPHGMCRCGRVVRELLVAPAVVAATLVAEAGVAVVALVGPHAMERTLATPHGDGRLPGAILVRGRRDEDGKAISKH